MVAQIIPESVIERTYEKQCDSEGKRIKQKDVNRSPNVTDRLEEYISLHNESLQEDSPERLLWFADSLTNKQRQKRAKNIIRDKLNKNLRAEWIDGSITFNTCQLDHGTEVEACIEELATVPLLVVYTQSERHWAIRRLIEDVFSSRRKTYLRKKRKSDLNAPESLEMDEIRSHTVPDIPTGTSSADNARLTETEAAVASSQAYQGLSLSGPQPSIRNDTDPSQSPMEERDHFDDLRLSGSGEISSSEGDIDKIESQINALAAKKRRLESRGRDIVAGSRPSKPLDLTSRGTEGTKRIGPTREFAKTPKRARRRG